MATRKILTDEQVVLEVERLKKSEHVKLCWRTFPMMRTKKGAAEP